MPCLDEAETVGTCVAKARGFLERNGIAGEVIVADNGSTDGSREIARAGGARVVEVNPKGYGSALIGGIDAALGTFVIMGDADDSYDFSALDVFVDKLREGFDLVMGNRFEGGLLPGAMPFTHRVLGNPLLSGLGRFLFGGAVGDFHCGLRGIRRDVYARLQLQTLGMEFASEMVIKAELLGVRIAEVPIVLHPDGRSGSPHLRTFRDGWRHLRFMLLFSPRWLFLFPGMLLFGAGALAGLALAMGPIRVGAVVFDIHTMLVSGMACLLGYQLIIFAIFTRVFAITEGFAPMPPGLGRLFDVVSLELGLVAGVILLVAGLGLLQWSVSQWGAMGLADLEPTVSMRSVIPAVVLSVLGLQTIFSSFFLSILGLRRQGPGRGGSPG